MKTDLINARPLPQERAGVRASVTTKVQFSLATRADDFEIRRLLRENPMPGAISLSLEREPDYFADADVPGEQKQTIVAREADRVVCVGSCTTRLRFVNGQPRRVGYLGGLRLDASVAGRFDILRRGYEFFRELQTESPADFHFTSIAADNLRARSFLERCVRGMPRYEFVGEFATLLIGAPSTASASSASHPQRAEPVLGAPQLANSLNHHNQHLQLAPHWTNEQLQSLGPLGLRAEDFYAGPEGNNQVAAALWDQRSFKQTVIRGYAPWLAVTRPALNLLARISGNPRLPAVGAILLNAFISHLAVASDDKVSLLTLVAKLQATAKLRDIELLTLGFAANDPRLAIVQKQFRCREYRSRLYVVRWPGIGGAAEELDGRILAPEVALL
ncbi:MAG: hypothetical protein HOP33_07915 [Verrucomicrobia bacterium]|nr:hypothetical protein [Verrucomicrobiota bacterium]